jgi:hypothetical protein
MRWLQAHSWWGLLAVAAAAAWSGFVATVLGVTYQAVDVTGKTISDITAESSAGAQLSDFSVRTDGIHLMLLAVLASAVLVFGFQRNRRWAWWAMWTLPILTISTSGLDLAFGATGPAISASIVGALTAAILAVSAPRFF